MASRSSKRSLWETLKGPDLVWDIQRYFGIRYVKPDPVQKSQKMKLVPNGKVGVNGLCQTSSERRSGKPQKGVKINEKWSEEETVSESDGESQGYMITNRLWYYLFSVGAAMGDEAFYAAFFTFWFWNIDGAVGRRVMTVWAVSMYIGQGLKDVIQWPRPSSPPVFRLEKKWELEYGMPSTHAMVGVTVPFSIIIYTVNRYQYPLPLGLAGACAWCLLVCISRLYLGMHSALDVLAGVGLASLLMIGLVPLADWLDYYFLNDGYAVILMLVFVIFALVYYPTSDRWTPARGDTTIIMGTCAGVQAGAWTCSRLGLLSTSPVLLPPPPYAILWPTYEMLGLALLRTVIGLCMVVATRAIFKSAAYATLCLLLHLESKALGFQSDSVHNKRKVRVELSYKFITYVVLGFNVICLSPAFFRLVGIERPTFHTEV